MRGLGAGLSLSIDAPGQQVLHDAGQEPFPLGDQRSGQFDRAAHTAERVLMTLGTNADPGAIAAARGRLDLYRLGKAYIAKPSQP